MLFDKLEKMQPPIPEIIKCLDGTIITTRPGEKGTGDRKIFTHFPYSTFPQSLYYVGSIVRLKARLEDINYPPDKGKKGRKYLLEFITECIMNESLSIYEICKKYKIPIKEK